jgi:hypothetical protein
VIKAAIKSQLASSLISNPASENVVMDLKNMMRLFSLHTLGSLRRQQFDFSQICRWVGNADPVE